MLRTLRGRITFSYVAFVMILFLLVAAILAREAVFFYVRGTNDAIASAGNQIHDILQKNPDVSFNDLSAEIHKNVDRPGLRIVAFQHPPGMTIGRGPIRINARTGTDGQNTVFIPMQPPPIGPPQQGPPPPPPDSSMRVLFSIQNIAGIRPVHLETKNASILVSSDPTRLKAILTSYALLALAGLVAFGALGWLIGRYFADQALAPMVAVTGALQRFASGDFTPQRIDTQDRSEVGELAHAFNGAAAQVTAAFDERRRVEEYIRQFVADASHELRTPLTVIRGYLEVLRRGALADPEKRDRAFATLDMESARMRALIDKLVVLARLERPEPSQVVRVDVAAIARNLADGARAVAGHPPVSLDLDDGAHVLAEESELHEALANLLDNARKYGEGAPIEISVKRSGAFVLARVIDAGPGIPEKDQA
ncbi:MAG: HAMP domain-containing protein, partial [Candidatus Eremiobacteraeota bacterium]|nr:HAMP domain-containing protein [Candidatus Eremiobacteraeota bacterium]